MTTDVVVVSWRARDLLARCLEHLDPDGADWRLIVVDNASDDGTAAMVRARWPHATVLEQAENVGFGRAVNAGVAAGRGEAIVLVNNDVFADPGFVEALVAPLAADPVVGMVAGLTRLPGEGPPVVDGFGIEVDATLAAYNRLRMRSPDERPGVLLGPSGGAAAYRRSAFERAGGFDERLFAYAEDLDLALRLRREGWTAAAAPAATGVHLGGASTGVDSPFQRRLAGFGRGFVLRRYGVLRGRTAARALLVEVLVIAFGLLRHRTLVPLTARTDGWRAASTGPVLRVPPEAVDRSITLRESLRRLRGAR